MSVKPKLKTGTLSSPSDWEPIRLTRAVTTTSSSAYDSQPDPQSPSQRTLHQAMQNRLVGTTNVYNFLREFAFRISWGHQPESLADLTITLAIAHQSHGPKVAVIIRSAQWSTAHSERLIEHGWHVIVFDSQAVVQSPSEVVDSMLSVLNAVACLPIGTGDLNAPTAHALHSDEEQPEPEAPTPIETPPRATNLAKNPVTKPVAPKSTWRLPIVTAGIAAVLAGVSMWVWREQLPVNASWKAGLALESNVAHVVVTPEGHAAVTLKDGRKTFVPAHSVRHNPNLLHELIMAWKEGKSLNIFTTNHQHLKYGREIGVKASPLPKPNKKVAP